MYDSVYGQRERENERRKENNRIDLISRSGDVSYVGSRAGGERQKCGPPSLMPHER